MIAPDADKPPLITDDEVIDQPYLDRAPGGDQPRGHGEIRRRCRRIAGGMIVHRDTGRRPRGQRRAEERTRSGIGAVDIALRDLAWLADEAAARIERQTPEPFVIEQHQFAQVLDRELGRGQLRSLATARGRRDAVGQLERGGEFGRLGRADAA